VSLSAKDMRCLLALALAAVLGVVTATATSACDLTIDVWYPSSNLPANPTFSIAGTPPLNWNNPWGPLTQVATDHWQAVIPLSTDNLNASLPQWEVAFKVLVDGVYELGANHRITATYPQTAVNKTIYPYFETAEGATFTINNVYSPQLNNTRDVWIYAPPAMVENTYFWAENVIVMQDGQNLAPLWNVTNHVNSLIDQQLMEQLFIIGPYNTPDRIGEYTYSKSKYYGGGKGDIYLDWVQDTLVPLVATKFQIRTAQPNLAIGGSSLGGLISCYAGITRPHIYSKMICMSSSFWWNNADFHSTIIPQLTDTNGKTQSYYLDSGDSGNSDDDIHDTSIVSTSFLTSLKGFTLGKNFFWYCLRGGQHNEYYWSERFHHPMQWLYMRPAVWNWGD